jgi:hypothetical protein
MVVFSQAQVTSANLDDIILIVGKEQIELLARAEVVARSKYALNKSINITATLGPGVPVGESLPVGID